MNKTIEEIFNGIKHNEGRLPKEELQELIRREDETRVFLIDYMEDFKKDYKVALEDMSYFGHIYATYLLAQFKEKKFYDIYLDILELADNEAMALYDDGIKEHGGKIIASVYNGDDTRLIEIIQSDNVSKEVKYAVKNAFEIIQRVDRRYIDNIFDEIVNWECFKGEEEREEKAESEKEEEDSLNNLIASELKKGLNDFIMKNSVEIGRNDSCSCGSGKKYKKCCGK